jgi:hypothetical protein
MTQCHDSTSNPADAGCNSGEGASNLVDTPFLQATTFEHEHEHERRTPNAERRTPNAEREAPCKEIGQLREAPNHL